MSKRLAKTPAKQRGLIGILLLVTIAIATVAVFTKNLWGADPVALQQQQTQAALRQAKEALLAYVERGEATGYISALGGNAAGVGADPASARLPCIDGNGDGLETPGCGTGPAAAAAGVHSLGLLPWQTLGIPKLTDGSGECLWYAVSGTFKNNPSTAAINGDSNGLFSVIQPVKVVNPTTGAVTWAERLLAGDTGAVAASPDRVVAVIIAPGAARAGQNRRRLAASRECPLPVAVGGIPNAVASAPRYLETYIRSNLTISNSAIALPANLAKTWAQADTERQRLNDEIIWITAEEFSKAAAKRTLNIYKTAIEAFVYGFYNDVAGVNAVGFVAGNGFYPSAASEAGGACVAGRLQGFVPFECPAGTPLNFGGQIGADGWNTQAHYAVSESCIAPIPDDQVDRLPPFTAANPPMQVCRAGARIAVGTDTASVHALILMRGRPRTGQPACGAHATMFNCLEDPINSASVLAGNSLVAAAVPPFFPATIAPNTYMPVGSNSNDLLYLFRQRTR